MGGPSSGRRFQDSPEAGLEGPSTRKLASSDDASRRGHRSSDLSSPIAREPLQGSFQIAHANGSAPKIEFLRLATNGDCMPMTSDERRRTRRPRPKRLSEAGSKRWTRDERAPADTAEILDAHRWRWEDIVHVPPAGRRSESYPSHLFIVICGWPGWVKSCHHHRAIVPGDPGRCSIPFRAS